MTVKRTIKKNLPTGQIRSVLSDELKINVEERTVELTWTTGSKGLRWDWGGQYYEELSLDPEHVKMSRLQNGAPLLAAHDSRSLDSVIGVVDKAWLENGKGKAIVRFSKDPEADKVFQKVQERILRNVSVGYDVKTYANVSEKNDEIPTYRAINWEPMEISIVPIGFDANAQIRSKENINEVEIITNNATEENVQRQENKGNQNMTDEEKKALELAAKKAEKQRQTEIREAVKTAKLESTFAEELINNDVSSDEARKRIFEKMAQASQTVVNTTVKVEVATDEKEKKREAVENALLHRVMPSEFKLSETGREVRGMDLIRMGALLTNNQYGSDIEIAKRAMSSSDLPLILANVAEKSVQKAYALAPSTFEKWVNQKALRNYKKASQVRTGDFPSLNERAENGEFVEGSFSEEGEEVQLKKFGKILSFSQEMMINDDMGVLADFLSKAGAAGKRLESKLVYDRLQASTAMKDGTALFHADHGNLGTAGAISETTMDEIMKLLKAQKSLDDEDYLDIVAAYLICGPLIETSARKFLSSIIPNQTSSVNPFANSVELIVDPRITSKNWFVAADKNLVESINLYRLLGQESPVVSTRNKWEDGSFQIKVEHTAAAQAMDYRGIVKNPYT